MSKAITISEIFGPTLQGEGALMGRPTLFVRTGGCDFRCSWCDTMYAVDPTFKKDWRALQTCDVMAEIERLSLNKPMMVTLSGGNPALQDLGDLIDLGQSSGYEFAMETQGSIVKDWFAKLDVLTLSPKGPSSGEETDWESVNACVEVMNAPEKVSLKIVIFDEADYEYAQFAAKLFPHIPLYLQAGNPVEQEEDIPGVLDRLRWLAEKVTQDRWKDVCVLPQMHVLTWGNVRGV